MARCPLCAHEIDHLTHASLEWNYYRMWLEDGNVEYEQEDAEPVPVNQNNWQCPECLEVVAVTEGQAITILKGE